MVPTLSDYIPVCFIVIALAWPISILNDIKLRKLMTVIVPIAVSFVWYFITYLPALFRSHLCMQVISLVAWWLTSSIALSIVAIPTSIISVYVFCIIKEWTYYYMMMNILRILFGILYVFFNLFVFYIALFLVYAGKPFGFIYFFVASYNIYFCITIKRIFTLYRKLFFTLCAVLNIILVVYLISHGKT